ncbi:MAG TPA: chorismate synthase [Vicinamibacterales bacterium]|nr:chorismate synthase [Vicinamibacterales bacterium]
MLRFLTAGESHGQALVVIVEGVPAGLPLGADDLSPDLARRQLGYGRGRRMAIEQDRAEILSGVRRGETLGAPIALVIRNRDWTNWQHTMSLDAQPDESLPGARRAAVTRPRPGHADLAGGLKYSREDLRDVLERASARETAARVAAGAIARKLLARYHIDVTSHVIEIGGAALADPLAVRFEQARALAADDDVRCVDAGVASAMRQVIDKAKEAGDTVGGAFEVIAHGVPPGLGSYVHWDRKLDGRLAQAVMSIPAIKAVGLGRAAAVGHLPGSKVHDEILPADGASSGTVPGLRRPTNNAGGLEGGVTNGEDVRVTAWMKPISTLMKPLRSVDLSTLSEAAAAIERSDVCAVPAAAVVGEAVVAFVLADALLEKLGADSVGEIDSAFARLTSRLTERLTPHREPI